VVEERRYVRGYSRALHQTVQKGLFKNCMLIYISVPLGHGLFVIVDSKPYCKWGQMFSYWVDIGIVKNRVQLSLQKES